MLTYRQGTHLVYPRKYAFHHLQSESILLLEDDHRLRDHAISACKIRGLEKISRFVASSLSTLIEMVDAYLGFTFPPEMVTDSAMLAHTNIEITPLQEATYREIAPVWGRGSARREEFALLGKFIIEHRP